MCAFRVHPMRQRMKWMRQQMEWKIKWRFRRLVLHCSASAPENLLFSRNIQWKCVPEPAIKPMKCCANPPENVTQDELLKFSRVYSPFGWKAAGRGSNDDDLRRRISFENNAFVYPDTCYCAPMVILSSTDSKVTFFLPISTKFLWKTALLPRVFVWNCRFSLSFFLQIFSLKRFRQSSFLF